MSRKKAEKWIAIVSVCILFAVIAAVLVSSQGRTEFPPLIVVNEVEYKRISITEQQPTDCIYLGEVLTSVPSTKAPIKNFEANDDLVGDPVYQSGDDIVVYHAEKWWIYQALD